MHCTRIRELKLPGSGEAEKCDSQNQICRDSMCVDQGQLLAAISYECKIEKQTCSNNDECCSGTCSNNKCLQVMECTLCKSDNSPIDKEKDEKCCPGYTEFNGRCMPPIPVFVPTVKMTPAPQNKNIIQRIFNILIPSAQASDLPSADNLTEGQQEVINEKTEKCDTDFTTGSDGHIDCMTDVNQQKTYYGEDGYSGVNTQQMRILTEMRSKCTEHETDDSEGSKWSVCMAEAKEKEMGYLKENADKAESCKDFEIGSLEYKECLLDKGALGVNLHKDEQINEYNIPGVTAKTYSNPKKCEFNSFNDSWRDASTRERNAELFLRSFEYVFSHKGTQDYWVNEEQRSIFERANEVAIKFRENRTNLMERMQEIDKKMACKCIGINGIKSAEQKSYFNSSCPDQTANLDLNTTKDEDGKIQFNNDADGAAVGSINKDKNISDEELQEVDKGAIALSKTKYLIEWLDLRAESQMERFSDNSDLEEQLVELSESISEINFSEVYMDKIVGGKIDRNDTQDGKSEQIHKWGYWFYAGWVKIAIAVVAAVSFAFIPGVSGLLMTSLVMGLGGVVGAVIANRTINTHSIHGGTHKAGASAQMLAAWGADSEGKEAVPEIIDAKTKKKGCYKDRWGICYKKYDGYTRYFVGPRYVHPHSGTHVYGRASALFRSGYRVDYNNAINFMIDPTLPHFVNPEVVAVNRMHGAGTKDFLTLFNDAFEDGFRKIQNYKQSTSDLKGGYKKESRNYGDKKVLAELIGDGYFLPLRGDYEDFYFEDATHDGKNKIMAGAQKYALCKSLNACGPSASALDPRLIGFGYLFESKSEAKVWSEYTYEIHYKWSHLSKNNFMGYPLVGLETYFQQLAFNMKLAGSLAASRSVKYAEAADLYRKDFEARANEYGSLGEAGQGESSRNLKFSPGLFKSFGLINFSGPTDIVKLKQHRDKLISEGKLGKAELKTFNSGIQHAIRVNADIDKKDAFEKAVAKSSDKTKNILSKNKKFLTKISTPLSQFGMAKLGGGGSGFKRLSSAISGLNKSLKNFNKRNQGYSRPSGGGSVFTLPKGGGYGSSYSSSYKSQSSLPSNSGLAKGKSDHNMSDKNVSSLLNKLKDSDLKPNDNDSLFLIVSKAYKRNYSRVLKRSEKGSNSDQKGIPDTRKTKKINSKSKEELRKLLQD